MSYCLTVCFILTLHMVGGNLRPVTNGSVTTHPAAIETTVTPGEQGKSLGMTASSSAVTAATAAPGDPEDHRGAACAWWCSELSGIVAVATAGSLLLLSVVLAIVSCCLWRRIKCSNRGDVRGQELDVLGPQASPSAGTLFPLQKDPPATKDVGISDVENSTLDSEVPQKETQQDVDGQIPDGAANCFPPPEDIPMLPCVGNV
ncbi:uncharacterized protein [Dendropsophus ebraccatus]|uniref:uncharacterized protein isoform X2 n=1 Tax=Dendropsophus ebraccatus TaxID=150705 RepID=UPI003831CEDA